VNIQVINNYTPILPSITNLDEFESILEELNMYNPRLGPIRWAGITQHTLLGVSHISAYTLHCDFKEAFGIDVRQSFIPAGGKGKTISKALSSAFGEGVERILSVYTYYEFEREGKIIYAKVKDMVKKGENILGPRDIHLFAPEQYKEPRFLFQPFTEESYLGWVEGRNILTGEKVYAPAQLILFIYRPKRGETLIGYSHSGGLSCRPHEISAIYHGIREVIERDALNIRWVAYLPPKEVVFTREQLLDLFDGDLPAFMTNPFIKVGIYEYSVDIPLSVFVVNVINPSYSIYSYIPGAGADLCPIEALQIALGELAQAEAVYPHLPFYYKVYNDIPPWAKVSPNASFKDIDNLFKSILYYGYEKNRRFVEEFYSRARKINWDQIRKDYCGLSDGEKLNIILKILKENEMRPIAFDLTPSFLKRLKVIKVFIPELVQYFIVYPAYGHPRYYEVGLKIGEVNRRLTYNDLNKLPPPFP
jgi:ribosomal protein S12 methylthiotransferase accessory factor